MDIQDNASINALIAQLESCVKTDNPNLVVPVILKLGEISADRNRLPDELVDRLLRFLGSESVLKSKVAASILQFFNFEALRLTKRQRKQCLDSLQLLKEQFTDADALWMAAEVYDRLLIAKG